MAVKKGGLGRGLDSLFMDSSPNAQENAEVTTLPLREIEPDKDQPRKVFKDDALAELSASIAEHGLLQPIAVRANPAGGYRIIAGERRWRAARMANLTEVPVVIKEVTDEQAMELALIENLQREDLDPVEEALGYKNLMDRCGFTQEKTAKVVSKSRSAVANSLRLLALPEPVLQMLQDGALSMGHAKVILGLDPAKQLEVAEQVVREKLNVRQTEQLCKKLTKPAPAPKAPVLRPALPCEVELSLKETIGNEVRVQYQEGKGTLTLHFYSDEQLTAYANLLGNYKQ